ncbi:hypothetical protein B0T16DRAFT_391325 [Cercophora newfieldiana]|uniref:Uncharacterized protein n=1 Tax=Cercophora newfieldiana TaxID=92897 RepID=A0AA40CQ50_9PEZI|nr:hypothetical protein B0T16DRAFT_391325 [Cercophora newfieldiana]
MRSRAKRPDVSMVSVWHSNFLSVTETWASHPQGSNNDDEEDFHGCTVYVPLAINREIGYNSHSDDDERLPEGRPSLLPLIRRFQVKIDCAYHPLDPSCSELGRIREGTRDVADKILAEFFPRIDFLRLDCTFRVGLEFFSYRSGGSRLREEDFSDKSGGWEEWKQQRLGDRFLEKEDKEEKKLTDVVQTWLGRLRNVGTVVIKGEGVDQGIPSSFAETMRRRLQSSQPPVLTNMYLRLEEHVSDAFPFCKKNLARALMAVERDDLEGFKKHSAAIKKQVADRLREMKQELYEFDPAEGEEDVGILECLTFEGDERGTDYAKVMPIRTICS